MFNIYNKDNARTALKEYGEKEGLPVKFEIFNGGSPDNICFTAAAQVGERHFGQATAHTKRDAKEIAADLALKEISSQHQTWQRGPVPGEQYSLSGEGDMSSLSCNMPAPRFNFFNHSGQNRISRKQRSKKDSLSSFSASPDKDPVMLLNEYGQKKQVTVRFEDIPCLIPGSFEAQVVVDGKTFGPVKAQRKKNARKLAAIHALKELINWQSSMMEDFLNESEAAANQWPVSGEENVSSSGESTPRSFQCSKDPLMVLNEFCQRKKLKIEFEALPATGPDHKRTFQYRAIVGDRTFKTGTGTSKSQAKKKAAIYAMEDLLDDGVNTEVDGKKESVKMSVPTIGQDPVSMLNEYSQKQRQKVEFEDLGYTGPDHGRVYQAQVTVGNQVFDKGSGHSKKQAKKQAALIAVNEIFGLQTQVENIEVPLESDAGKDKADSLQPPSSVEKNSISVLNEFCQANHLGSPVLVEVSPDQRQDPRMCYLRYQVDQKLYDIGEGLNKKDAKYKAASLALAAMTEWMSRSDYNPVSSTSEGDKFASLSWNWFATLCSHTTDAALRFSGYKVLATFILQQGNDETNTIVSLGTGNKCIGGDQLRLDGTSINDSHAEVVARRGLIRYLIQQLELFFTHPEDPNCIFVQADPQGKVKLREGVKFLMYCSLAPCGDAAIFANGIKAGKGQIQRSISKQEGLLRTKVEKGEGTIPLQWSDGLQTIDGIKRGQRLRTASCSDKIAKWNVIGVQGALLANIIEPIYLDAIVTGTLYDPTHMARAVSGRIEGKEQRTLSDHLPDGYCVNHPTLMSGDLDSSRSVETKHKSNSLSMSWTMGDKEVEVHDGCSGRPAVVGSQSRLTKAALFSSLREVLKKSPVPQQDKLLDAGTYRSAKELAVDYQQAKSSLYQHLEKCDLGSWELMKKPAEMEQFSFE